MEKMEHVIPLLPSKSVFHVFEEASCWLSSEENLGDVSHLFDGKSLTEYEILSSHLAWTPPLAIFRMLSFGKFIRSVWSVKQFEMPLFQD